MSLPMWRRVSIAALAAVLLITLPAYAHLLMVRGGGSAGGGGATQITTITLSDTSGTNQTNVPVTIGLPLAAGSLPSGEKIAVLDSDGVTALPVQEDNRASDLSNNVRFDGLTVIVPSLSANQTKTLTVEAVSGSPATGTDIAESDILATSYDYTDTFNDHDGNTYTCSARTGLAAGAYTNTTTAATLGTWRHGGGLATEYIVMVPPTTTGGTPHPQLRCLFDVLAFKAGSGVVSGSNPIIAIRTDAVVGTGWIQNTTPVTDDWYGLTETSGSTTISYPNSTPTQTLTVANNARAFTNVTASSSLFTANSLGSLITDGTGYAVIVGYTSPTQVNLNVYKAFASATLTSGNYTIYGVAHTYGSRYRERIWWNGLATPQYAANLGPAWDNSTLTGGPFAYFSSTNMVLNYATPASSITNDLTKLNSDGTNPVAYTNTANPVGEDSGGSFAGDIEMYIGNTGENTTIGVQSDWDTKGLIRYDANALTAIFGNGDKGNLMPINMRNPATGVQIPMNNGTNWDWDYSCGGSHFQGTYLYLPSCNSSATNLTDWDMEDAHMGQFFYMPYLLTGDWYWFDSLEMLAQYLWMNNNPGYSGSQLDRLKIINDQMRGEAWSMRTIGDLAVVTPDNTPAVEGWPKTHIETWLSNQWTATNSGTAGVAPYPGAVISFLNNTGTGQRYATVGPRWTGAGGSGDVESQWQLGYFVFAMFHLKELGMLDTNGLSMLAWAGEGITSAAVDTAEVNPAYTVNAYWSDMIYPAGTNLSTWSQVYGATAVDPVYTPGNSRQLSGTLTLSANYGTAITATVPTGNFNGGNFYVGGWICAASGPRCLMANGSGTIATTASSDAVTGTNTQFTTQFVVGDTIEDYATAEVHTVTSIASNTSLTVDSPWSATRTNDSYRIGANGAKITAVAVNSPAGYDTLTLNTSGYDVHDSNLTSGGTFGSLSYAGGAYVVPAPAPGDPIGTEMTAYFNAPGNDYHDIAHGANIMLNQDGYPDEPGALDTVIAQASAWTSSWEIKWHVAPR